MNSLILIEGLAEHRGLFHYEVYSMLSLPGAVGFDYHYAVEISTPLGRYDRVLLQKKL